jgi:hypothetical protein
MKRNVIRLSVVCLLAVGILAFASPGMLAQAATVRRVTATCSRATVSGRIEQPARYVQISVSPASDLSHTIAKVYARVWGRSYSKSLSYSPQMSGSRLIFAICESDGSKCLRAATMVGVNCQDNTPVPSPTPISTEPWPTDVYLTDMPPTPTDIPLPETLTPWPTSIPLTPTPFPLVPQVTCSWTGVSGRIDPSIPYMRLTISQSNPIKEIGAVVVPVQPDGSFSAIATYPLQPEGSLLIGAIGEWDGSWWLNPARTFSAYCSG